MQPSPNSSPTDDSPGGDSSASPAASSSWRAGLYLLPALIVLVFVASWLFVFWLFHENQDAHSLAQSMQQPGRRNWQRAYSLSQLMLDPDNDRLKDDAQLCGVLAATLSQQNQEAAEARAAGDREDEQTARFRVFLCRALGEFRLLEGLPPLLACAATETMQRSPGPHEREVRRAAIEAIAVLAGNVGGETLRAEPTVFDTLLAATQAVDPSRDTVDDSDIAAAATFALGVLGGPRATEELVHLTSDARSDVRYNAATGLARHGRAEGLPVLLQMLDPDDLTASRYEKTPSARARKQLMVQSNGIQAALRLYPSASADDRQKIVTAWQRLIDSESVAARARIDAKEALLKANRAVQ